MSSTEITYLLIVCLLAYPFSWIIVWVEEWSPKSLRRKERHAQQIIQRELELWDEPPESD